MTFCVSESGAKMLLTPTSLRCNHMVQTFRLILQAEDLPWRMTLTSAGFLPFVDGLCRSRPSAGALQAEDHSAHLTVEKSMT